MMIRYSFFVSFLFMFFAGIMGQYENCTGQLVKIDDGECDAENNNIDCGYDGGDCCECTCKNDRLNPCGIRGFSCADPNIIGNETVCYNEAAFVRHCSSDAPVKLFVNDTASAIALADAVNCSDGTFNVTWRGSVLVNRTLYIPNNTTLHVTGEDSGAEVDGEGKTRLFMIVNASLYIEGLVINNGNATYGGAIAATRSNIFLNKTVFSDNTVSSYGGAINIGIASTLVLEGKTVVTGNYAGRGGGAIAVSMGSSVSTIAGSVNDHSRTVRDKVIHFTNNTANNDGGALYIASDCRVSWDGEVSFFGNTASKKGGALLVLRHSDVSWDGETSFIGNEASENGGALYIHTDSVVEWDGETSFVNNTASKKGGALYIHMNSIVRWDGKTSFVNNNASEKGGALFAHWYSFVSWHGETSFVNNSAIENGGALHIRGYSNVSWHGEASFVNNTANIYGGAMYIESDCIVSWDGETSFFNNRARENGGGLYIFWYSDVSWDGNTSFVKNTAKVAGGALYIAWYSGVSWDGETSFVGNAANADGGALYLSSYSRVLWDRKTSFVANTASDNGGALYIDDYSSVSWDGKTSFVGNTACDNGGASYISSSSNITWDGQTLFTGNIASSSGGAVYVETSSKISVGGETCFLDNEAAIDGGAVYVYVGHGDKTPSYLFSDNSSAVLFRGNTCGGNGGAIAFTGEVVARFSLNMMFLKNTAGVAGGAVYISSVTIGMRFEGVIFKSNSAVIGGGLYLTGSGTAVTEASGKPEHNPTTLIGCKFIGNTAVKTGGGMNSGAGRDLIVNSYFVGNIASLGGGLRLVGTTSLIGCEFVNNLSSEDGGPGISNDGVITSVSNCIFVGNVFSCQAGFFLAYNDTDALFDTVCKGCDIPLTGNNTVEDKDPICLEELEHSHSTGGNTTLESLLIERGYWRATNTSINILACYNRDACIGGLTGEQGFCSKGYQGPYCSVCSKRYSASLGFACNKCSDNAAGAIALAIAMAAVFLLAFAAFLSYMLSGETRGADRGIVARVTRFIPLQSVKIVIVVWQILTQFSTVANVVFPSIYQKFLDSVDILNFDLGWVISTECIVDTDFHDQLLLATLGPLVCIAVLGGTYVVAMRRSRESETAQKIARRKHVSMVLLLTFLVYSSVSSTLFKTFSCDELDDGKNYLRADYRIDCDASKHGVLEIYGAFMIIVYVVGIPAFYSVLLYNNREALMNDTSIEEVEGTNSITDLWKPYRPDRFYYEVVECVRRVLLTGALVFIYPNTAAQIAVALMIATFFIFVSEALAPYASPWDTWCSRMGHAIVYTSMFLALLIKVDVSGESASSQRIFELILIGAHSFLILAVVVEAIAMIVAWRTEVQEQSEPRIRPSLSISCFGVDRDGTSLEEDGVSRPYRTELF